MRYHQLKINVSLNDPEQGFSFRGDGDGAVVSFRDWCDQPVELRFTNVYSFSCFYRNGYKRLPEGAMVEITDSPEIAQLLESQTAGPEDRLRHFVVSTNEEQWCEVIASSFSLQVDAAVPADRG